MKIGGFAMGRKDEDFRIEQHREAERRRYQAQLEEEREFRRALATDLRNRLRPHSLGVTISADEARSIIEALERD